MKVLILGYSNIVRKRVLRVFKENNLKIYVASKTHKKKISGVDGQFNSYLNALKKSKPSLVYISLPNSEHFIWAKKSLNFKFNTIVDKPITLNVKQLEELINYQEKIKSFG